MGFDQTPPASNSGWMHDGNGNLVLDDAYFYNYDAFNRLARVSYSGTLAYNRETGVLTGSPGDWIANFNYDAFGRLVRTQRPIPTSATQVYTERYYYDGVRRIQEVHTDPLYNPTAGGTDGETGEEESEAGEGNGPLVLGLTWVDAEYIYTPDGVDEFGCKTDRYGTPIYVLHDAIGDVVGLVSATGSLLRQSVFDPYGELKFTEPFAAHAAVRMGRQGLFFERTDAPQGSPHLVTGAEGLYFNRGRWYSARTGRFLQADPNATAMPLIEAMAFNGQPVDAPLIGILPTFGLFMSWRVGERHGCGRR